MKENKKERRKLPRIEVTTKEAGYTLDIEGCHGFMYFTPEKLLEGFMLHVGLKMTDHIKVETMKDFIKAACNASDTKRAAARISKLTNDIKTTRLHRASMGKQLIQERERYNDLIEDLEIWRAELNRKSDFITRERLDKILGKRPKLKALTFKALKINIEDLEELEEQTF
jgi:hypothetical protein